MVLRGQGTTPVATFTVVALSTFVVIAMTPPLLYIVMLVGNAAFSIAVGFLFRRAVNAAYGRNLPVANKAVFVTGCDTGFGRVIAVTLRERGFNVFAGCLDPKSDGAEYLRPLGVHVLHVDYLKPDTVVNAYDKISDVLEGKALWAIVANAGVTAYGEVEWMQFRDFQWLINVNVLGTLQLIGLGLSQIKRSEGRVVIMTGLQGRLSIPGMAVGSSTAATLSHYADGLRREMAKFGVQVCTIEPAFYKTPMMDPDLITQALVEVTRKLPTSVQEEYGGSYLENFKFTFPKKLKKFSRSNVNEVALAVLRALLNRETNVRYCCCSLRQLVTWAVLEFLPLRIADLFMVLQFTPRIGVAGNIRVHNIILEPVTDSFGERSHVDAISPLLRTPPILRQDTVV